MKLYATTKSERASKGQGGNDYIETNFFVTSKEKANFRTRIINDEKMGLIYISFEEYFFGKWNMKYQTELFQNVTETKGKSQKGELIMCKICKQNDTMNESSICIDCADNQ